MGQSERVAVESLFLANIGTSDLGWNETPIIDALNREGLHARTLSDAVALVSKDPSRDPLHAIILQPSLQCVFERGVPSLQVILFVTQQTPPHPLDTAPAFPYLKQALEREFKFKLLRDIQEVTIPDNPAEWGLMHEFFKMRVEHLSTAFSPQRHVFVSVTGGTPAANALLLFQAVRIWQDKVYQVYKPRGSPRAEISSVGRDLLHDLLEMRYDALVQSRDFLAAAGLAEEHHLRPPEEVAILKGRYCRDAFDFKQARQWFIKARLEGQRELNEVNRLIDNPDTSTRLLELLNNMRHELERREYLDFLSRLYAFSDLLVRTVFFKSTGVKDDFDKESRTYPGFETFVKADPELAAKFEEKKWRLEPNFLTLPRVFNHLLQKSSLSPDAKHLLGKALEFAGLVKPLIDLRNTTIVAHGFAGASAEDVTQALGDSRGPRVLDPAQALIRHLGAHP
jgi:hypothetical protein